MRTPEQEAAYLKVRQEIANYLTDQFIGQREDYSKDECSREAAYILSLPSIGVIDENQTLPEYPGAITLVKLGFMRLIPKD